MIKFSDMFSSDVEKKVEERLNAFLKRTGTRLLIFLPTKEIDSAEADLCSSDALTAVKVHLAQDGGLALSVLIE